MAVVHLDPEVWPPRDIELRSHLLANSFEVKMNQTLTPSEHLPAVSDASMAPMIEGRNIVKIYGHPKKNTPGRKPAVNDVSFAIQEGELFVIMGLSGSGKSTLLRMLNRLIDPTSGDLYLDGEDLMEMVPKRLREVRNKKINMVFQHFAIFPHRTVMDDACYGLKVRGVPKKEREKRAMWALETVGLQDWLDNYPSDLSGGMRQRVGLARALTTDSEVLLMDEPFSALDPLIRRDMQALLLHLQKELKKTIVFVTHDLNEAMRLGDRIMVMRDGAVVQLGTSQEILTTPADDYVAEFVGDVDRTRVVTAGAIAEPAKLTLSVRDTPRRALARMDQTGMRAAYVLDEVDRLMGVVHLSSLQKTDPNDGLANHLSQDYTTVKISTTLNNCFRKVGGHEVPLAVIDEEHHLAGVLPRATLLSTLSTS